MKLSSKGQAFGESKKLKARVSGNTESNNSEMDGSPRPVISRVGRVSRRKLGDDSDSVDQDVIIKSASKDCTSGRRLSNM